MRSPRRPGRRTTGATAPDSEGADPSGGGRREVVDTSPLRQFGRHIRTHPLSRYLRENPPDGYRFSVPERRRLSTLWSLVRSAIRLSTRAFELGAGIEHVGPFFRSRGRIDAQIRIPARAPMTFLNTRPMFVGQGPWLIEIEDSITLFHPYAGHYDTKSVDLTALPCFPFLKALLESDDCRCIVTHLRSTAETLPQLFGDPTLRDKIRHVPFGIPLPQEAAAHDDSDEVTILFNNSWHQDPDAFYYRGGIDILEAFSVVSEKFDNVRLVLRTRLPPDLDDRYRGLIEGSKVTVIGQFLSDEEMRDLISRSDVYVLMSAGIHVISLLEAMGYGLAVVVSDGNGIEEYVRDGDTGLVVRGRHGMTYWFDEKGQLCYDFERMRSPDPIVVDRLKSVLEGLIENADLRRRLGGAARSAVERQFSMESWNRGFERALDDAFDPDRDGAIPAEADVPVGTRARIAARVIRVAIAGLPWAAIQTVKDCLGLTPRGERRRGIEPA